MDRKATLKNKLVLFKKKVSENFPVQKMIFFGSRATGKARKYSDVDLIIVSNKFKNKKFHQRPVQLYDYWNLDYPVDFLCYTPAEFNDLKKRVCIVSEAVKSGIVI